MDYLEKLDDMTWSHSRIQTFFQCPAAFKMRYLDKLPGGPQGIEAFTGQSVHKAVERLLGRTLTGLSVSLLEFREYYQAAWAEYSPDTVKVVRDGTEPQHYFNLGLESANNYYLRFYPFAGVTSSEKHVKYQLGRYMFQGYLDWTTADGGIWDLKTGAHMLTKDGAKYDLQLSIYEMGLRADGQTGPITQNWYYSRHDKVLTVTRTEAELQNAKERLLNMLGEIEEAVEMNHLPYRPNNFCPWCEYFHICPAQEMRNQL